MDGRHKKKRKTKKLLVDVPKKPRLHDNDSCVEELKEMADRDNDTSVEREEKETLTMAHTHTEDHSKGSDQEDSEGETTYEMNRPTLLRQLQTILGEYPDDEQMLREMVQNAEDAGANCMKIMYDSRTIDPGGTSKIKQYFRTPGICVYNDAMFTDDDWKGIISIYNSVKEKEPLKVGRFGLGFKSVFHMTDSPVIISGSKLLVIDPLRSEEKEEECRELKLKAIGRKHQPETTLACLMNKFGFNTEVLREGLYDGTIFWFPLRQKESKLSPTIYSEEKAENLFKSFMKKSTYNLMFLKNLEKIEIYNEQNDRPYFTLEITGSNEKEFSKARKMFKDDLNNLKNELPRISIMSQYEAVIKTNTTEEHYAVVNMLTGADYLSEQMNHLVSDSSLHYSPYTGVAYCMKPSIREKPPGHIFCFLPLPVTEKSMTGLPVHVNGFFDLEHNRRHIKEAAANNESRQTDHSLMWNDGMIGELLPETYYTLIEMMKTRCIKGNNSQDMVDQVYDAIPDPDAVESNWKLLLKKLFEKVMSEDIFFTRQDGGKWIEFSEALFAIFNLLENDNQKTKTTVKKLLLDCDENLVELPDHVITILKFTGHEPQSVTPQTVRAKLKSSECWKTYSSEEKLRLLSFVLEDCNYTDLNNLGILPLNNQEFVPFSSAFGTDVYVICDETANLFPGLEDQVISKSSVTDFIWKSLSKIAEKGLFQLRCLTDECLPGVIQKVFDINFIRKQNGRFVQASQSNLGIDWIHKVWKEIARKEYEDLSIFESIPVIVVGPDDVEDINNSATDESLVLEYVNLKGNYMLSRFDNHDPLPAALEKVVTLTEVDIFHPNQMIKFPHTDVIGKYIQLPIIDNVLNCFKMAALSSRHQQIAREINKQCPDHERKELVQFLTNHHSDIPREAYQFLRKLDLFCEHDNVSVAEMVSVEDNEFILKDFMYPEGISYPRKYLEREHAELAKLLRATDVEEIECIDQTLDLMLENSTKYSVKHYTQLMIYLQERPPQILNNVLEKAKSLKFMPSGDGTLHSVNNLFDPTSSFLKNLLYGEEGVFPNENFIQENGLRHSFMQTLGLKTEDNISSEDVVQVANSIRMFANGMDEKKYIKAESLISYLKTHEDISSNKALQRIKRIKWVPIDLEKPDDHPDGLRWCSSKTFCSPEEVKSMQFKNLIGTVCPLVRLDLFSKQITACYKWCVQPEQNDVIEHYRNVINSYEARQNSEYLHITKHIISYLYELWRAGSLNNENIKKLNAMECIPTNSQGFMSAQIVVQEIGNKHINYILEPYIFELARDVADFSELFLELGMKRDVDFYVLKSLLQRISEKYMSVEETPVDKNELEKDRTLTYNILKSIVAMDINKSELSEILIPINSQSEECIVFEKVEKCTYTSGKSPFSTAFCPDDDDEDDDCEEKEEKIIYVHPSVNELASKLGVASITKRFIYNQNTEVLAWGQEEKLTTRISGLLDSYTDGFAVPKELVQNADDAGATKVCFLYDERENLEWRNGLLDQGMAECHGPALWVYNDAIFEEKDFKNIIELGGKTKILDTEKIGKFGLGFCSVYNVTDVPSFVSKNTLVILDPHLSHLGEAAIGSNPGLKLLLTKKYRKNFPNQFKPYNDIFGCNLEPNNKDEYNNTLFRLPLRTQNQASESEITDKQYTKREVVELLKKFLDSAANLLLFTQNVKEICVYHLDSKGLNPDKDMKLLFKTWKENTELTPKEHGFNILKTITAAMKEEEYKEINFPVQVVDIGIKVSESAHVLSNEFQTLEKVQSWIISWGTGIHSFELAYRLKSQGAVPIGSVAVPIKRFGNEIISFVDLKDLPGKGFYKESRIFCFLPLPMETQLPVHINGHFMVEQDRKSITRFNKDDKTNESSSWNDNMLGDVIQSAYINLMTSVASRVDDRILQKEYWLLWPNKVATSYHDTNQLVRSFYQSILQQDFHVFYRKSNESTAVRSSVSNSIFLDPKFRESSNGQIAYECMLEFQYDETNVMDMPLHIFTNFEEMCKNDFKILQNRIISKDNFFRQYFFPYLKEKYWHQDGMSAKRDKLLTEALREPSLHELVKIKECIPVKPSENGILRRPQDLVEEIGLVGDMFEESDCRFVTPKFDKYSDVLVQLGMMGKSITSPLLTDRAQSVRNLTSDMAFKRSKAIVSYLLNNSDKHMDVKEKLQTIQFLPVMSKPAFWSLPWKAEDMKLHETFLSPSEMFNPMDRNVVGSVGYILDSMNGLLQENVLQFIDAKKVTIDDALTQLEILGKENFEFSANLKEICASLYNKLNSLLPENGPYQQTAERFKAIQFKKVVCLKSVVMKPDQLAYNLKGDCSPYLYKVNSNEYPRLWRNMEIPQYFDSHKFISVLQQKKMEVNEMKLSKKEVKSIVNILDNLRSALEYQTKVLTPEDKKTVFVPDNKCYLRPLSEICFDDKYPGFLRGSKDIHIIHSEVRSNVIYQLEVPSKRQFHLSRFSSGIPFGQKEKLVTRLRGIISAYPRDHSVLNEMLQNADDAGASEIHFVLDLRDHPTDKIFDEKWAPLQGPAICVFNDTCFSEDDLKGIQNLGEGSKGDDPLKTGQFGIGFNAVYHLTDVPSFLTRGSATPNGGTYCVFDPLCSYVPVADPDTPGMQIEDLKIIEESYGDIYHTYLQKEMPAETGTWFRLPLRTEESTKSDSPYISKDPSDIKSVEKMFAEMELNMEQSLLFLANVKKISISRIGQNGTWLPGSSVELSLSESDEERRVEFLSKMKEESKLLKGGEKQLDKIKFSEVRYEVSIKNGYHNTTWLIVQVFGFPEPSKVPWRLISEFSEGRIGLLPRSGTAISKSVNLEFEGKAFCFLPLPIETGLPAYVNGHFALDQNRSNIFGGTHKEDIRYIWNRCLIEQPVSHSYASCLEYFRDIYLEGYSPDALATYFKKFPIFENTSEGFWRLLTFAIYNSSVKRELALFPICPSFMLHSCTEHSFEEKNQHSFSPGSQIFKWIAIKNNEESFSAVFDELHKYFEIKNVLPDFNISNISLFRNSTQRTCTFNKEQELRLILINLGMKLVCTPAYVYESIEKACNHMQEHKTTDDEVCIDDRIDETCICPCRVSPKRTVQFLKSWNTNAKDKCLIDSLPRPVLETAFNSIDKLLCVLHFCQKYEDLKIENLSNTPLLVSNDSVIHTLETNNETVLSSFCYLFQKSSDLFVHKDEVSFLRGFEDSFRNLTMELLLELLPISIDASVLKVKGPISWPNEELLDDTWMRGFWLCLNDFFDVRYKLSEWCLFPCKLEDKSLKLVSFEMAFTVLDLNSFRPHKMEFTSPFSQDLSLKNILAKLGLPSPASYTLQSKHTRDLVATEQQPDKVVKCLFFHRDICKWHLLTKHDCNKILTFFAETVDRFKMSEKQKLKGLPLFTTLTGDLKALNETSTTLVVKCENLFVQDGLEELSEKTNTILLKHNAYHEKLYSNLGCRLCYPTDQLYRHPLLVLYTTFIFPNFANMERRAHLKHLEFVRDELMDYVEIKSSLSELAFIPAAETGVLNKANCFFSPHNSVCAKLCDPSELPPAPFCENVWKIFMETAGMKSIVTEALFLRFARQIQQNGKNSESEDQAKVLIKHLFHRSTHTNETSFMREISRINFITPYIVPDKYRFISAQSSTDKLISFQDGVQHKYFMLAWTMDSILPEYAVPTDEILKEKLHIKARPSIDCVVSHVHKVCYSLQHHPKTVDEHKQLMTIFYEYLENNIPDAEMRQLKIRFSTSPIIYIIEHNKFVQAKHVVIDLPKFSEIIPYLLKASTHFGQYFPLFKKLGTSENISIEHYCRVLAAIKSTAKESKIIILDELKQIEKATLGVFECLSRKDNLDSLVENKTVLYILDNNSTLKPSDQLVIIDNHGLKRRLRDQTVIDFICDWTTVKKHSKQFDPDYLLCTLPISMRPQILSDIVSEELLNSSNTVRSEMAEKLEAFVSGEIMKYIVSRLAKTRQKSSGAKLEESELQEMLSRLRSFRVLALPVLQTSLSFKGEQVHGSIVHKRLYFNNGKNIMYIKNEMSLTSEWISKNGSSIAGIISCICKDKVKVSGIQTCLAYFDSSFDTINEILDEYGAVDIDFKFEDMFWYPAPGTALEQSLVDFLIADFEAFEDGETVVYEHYDNSGHSNNDSVHVYIYVKVIKRISDENERFPIYLINVGEGQEIEARSHRLYRMERPSDSTSSELEVYTDGNRSYTNEKLTEIFQLVEETLVDAWKLGQDDFKRVVRRLIRRWHPDKNQNSSFCTEVFKHVREFVKKLQDGNIDASKIDKYREHGGQYWQEYMQRASSGTSNKCYTFDMDGFADDIIGGYRRRNRNRQSYTKKYVPDPQPHMGRVWIQQAKYDIDAAISALEFVKEKSYNWICVQSQQAAEKALKAVQVSKDANGVSNDHSLMLPVVYENADLRQLVDELQTKIVNYSRLRYPRLLEFPKTPAELYTQKDAEESVELARKIVNTVDDIYFQ
ncbi:sacsin-like [Mytilus californianus]|uniref:sacsin-like n=1 Tax=Mytilus californianus TaxID=6549 RepID=UPI0022460656|nr:sacsin-like [Mytilus californianus]